ncbi:MAG: RNA 2',3'-cyclic phosphodiesterase [Burkholderiales bacterium]|nr:RNA 2',3'-cyclic phosphodiesterase [Burkholderiales bacterium]
MGSVSAPDRGAQRLFFALWPNPKLQEALHRIGQSMQEAVSGRLVKEQNIHLTLAFLGSVSAERLDDLLAIGDSIRAEKFELKLSEIGCWTRSAVGWIAPESVPEPLEVLVLGLRQRLLKTGFLVDERPFAPHVTLLRKARCRLKPLPPKTPLEWRINQVVLMRSDTLPDGPEYCQVGSWPLMNRS